MRSKALSKKVLASLLTMSCVYLGGTSGLPTAEAWNNTENNLISTPGTYNFTGETITNNNTTGAPNNSAGCITVNSASIDVNLNIDNSTLSSNIASGNGNTLWLSAPTASINNSVINMGSGVTSSYSGVSANCLFVSAIDLAGTYPADVTVNNTQINHKWVGATAGMYQTSSAIFVRSILGSSSKAKITLHDSSVTTAGRGVRGIYIADGGQGYLDHTSVVTSGDGVLATSDANSSGIFLGMSIGAAPLYPSVEIRNGSSIETHGKYAVGIKAKSSSKVLLDASSVVTYGDQANGIDLTSAEANLNNAMVTTNGLNSDGISSSGSTSGNSVLNVVGSTINVNGANTYTSPSSSVPRTNAAGIFLGTYSNAIVSHSTITAGTGAYTHGIYSYNDTNSAVNVTDTGVEVQGQNSFDLVTYNGATITANGGSLKATGTDGGVAWSWGLRNKASVINIDGAAIDISGTSALASVEGDGVVNVSNVNTVQTAGSKLVTSTSGGTLNLHNSSVAGAAENITNTAAPVIHGSESVGGINTLYYATEAVNLNLVNSTWTGFAQGTAAQNVLKKKVNGVNVYGMSDGGVNIDLDSNSVWKLNADSDTYGDLINAGIVDMRADGNTYSTLTTANLSGSGLFKQDIDVRTMDSDKLFVTDDFSGTQALDIYQQGGYVPAAGTAEGIGLVLASTNGTGTFTAKDYEGTLFHTHYDLGSKASATAGFATDWYLQKIIRMSGPTTSVDAILSSNALNYHTWRTENDKLLQRMGELRNNGGEDQGAWFRVKGSKIGRRGQFGFENKYTAYELGYDELTKNTENGKRYQGAALSYTDGSSSYSRGSGDNSSKAISFYNTELGSKGHYLDVVFKVSTMSNDFTVYDTHSNKITGDFNNTGVALSAEYGRKNDLKNGWYIEPQAQFTLGYLGGDSYTTSNGIEVDQSGIRSAVGRIGFNIGKEVGSKSIVYAKANLLHEFGGGYEVSMRDASGVIDVSDSFNDTWFEYGVGAAVAMGANSQLYLDVERSSGSDFKKDWQWNAGARWTF